MDHSLTLLVVAVGALAAVVGAIVRARRASSATIHLVWAAAALAVLCLALPTYALGRAPAFYSTPQDLCRERGGGEFVGLSEAYVPVRSTLECSERTIELVPGWVNLALAVLLPAAVLCAVVAAIAWRRMTRSGTAA
jgi:hypothetical protein